MVDKSTNYLLSVNYRGISFIVVLIVTVLKGRVCKQGFKKAEAGILKFVRKESVSPDVLRVSELRDTDMLYTTQHPALNDTRECCL